MARTSRDPFSPLVPKKKKKNVKKAVVPAEVPAALGTRKKKKTTASASAKQNLDLLSNLDAKSIFPRNPPLRICHLTSPAASEMLLARLELRLPSHPLYFIFHHFLQLPMKIVTLSITTPHTKTLLRNLLRRQHVQQIHPMQWKTMMTMMKRNAF